MTNIQTEQTSESVINLGHGMDKMGIMNGTLQSWLEKEIQGLKDAHLYKKPRILDSPAGGRVVMDGKEVINLSSNNYLGLANHPKVRQAALDAIERWGVGAGAVRWIGGTMKVHDELEERIAKFKKVESVLVFTGGFTANSGCIPAVLTKQDVVISDELNHASIIDGVRLSPAEYRKSDGWVYAHKDMDALEDCLKRAQERGFEKKMIITDGVFSMDGDIAPLPEIVALAEQYDAFVMVDDAHSSGVLGKTGAGTTSHFDLYGRVDIQLGTLSKALGVVGGYIAGSKELKEWLINRGRPYLFSTAHPPVVAAALIAALDVMENDPEPMNRLWDNTKKWKSMLAENGFDTMGSETPITPILFGDAKVAQEAERLLWEEGVYALSIVYPTVALGKARIRTMPSAAHTDEDLDDALQAFIRVRDKLGMTV
ncbi:MAG: glycine C-acetyltransferase [Fimbriimonadaceae bacterium]